MYFLVHFNCYIRPKETTPDSTQSRDRQSDQQTLPETPVPDTEVLITVRPQITFLQHDCINVIFNIVIFTANATNIIPAFTNLPVTVNTLHISDAPRLHRDKQLEVFLEGEIHCPNFINHSLTFLQPSTTYEAITQEDGILPESNPTEVPLISNSNSNSNPSQASQAELFYDKIKITNRPTPILYHNNYQYHQYYTHDDASQVEQYDPPCTLCSGFNHSPKHCFKGEHDINNLMEKMSLDSSNQHQNGLYQ